MIFRWSFDDSLRNGLLRFWWSNTPRPSKLLWQTAQQHLAQDRSYPWLWHAMATLLLRFCYAFVGLLNKLSFEYFDFIWIWSNNLTSSDTQNGPPWKQSLFIRLFAASEWEDAQCLASRESCASYEYRKGATCDVRRPAETQPMESDARPCSSWKSWNPDRYAADSKTKFNWAKDGKEM